LAFGLTAADLEVPDVCPVLGIKLQPNKKGQPRANSPSLDRFDNRFGYVKGNVRVISQRANSLKSNATLEELAAVVQYMRDEPQGRTYSQTRKAIWLRDWKARQSLEWHEQYRAKKRAAARRKVA
jgi:hypothetical protein